MTTEILTPRGDESGDKKGVVRLSKHGQAPEKHEPEIRGARPGNDLTSPPKGVEILGRSEDKPAPRDS